VSVAEDAVTLLGKPRAYRPNVDIQMPPERTDDGLRAAQAIRVHCRARACWSRPSTLRTVTPSTWWATTPTVSVTCSRNVSGDLRSFVEAVRRVASGGSWLDPVVVERMVNRRRAAGPLDRLSPRERDVLGLMAQGLSNAGIAQRLFVTVVAVERHVTSIFDKLELNHEAQVHRRVLAVLRYLEQ
jgi:DNA-binding NarL/FixJ family response regulator